MMVSAYISGKFLREGQTRFVCWCEVEGRRRKCYVPMSTKLSRYFDPVGKEVRLELKGRRHWVEQVKLRGRWVWVDAAKPVELLKKDLERRGRTVETEKTVAGYRFDLWCEGVGYEVKSVLSDRPVVSYPNADSERRGLQLERLRGLIKKGVKVVWAFVVLSPSRLEINSAMKFGADLQRAVKAGLSLRAWSIARRRVTPIGLRFVGARVASKGNV